VNRRSSLRWGVAIAVLYLVACVATIATGAHRLRPLYEGIGPAAPYRWVAPPAQFKATNLPPAHASELIDLTASGSPQIGGETSDGQLVLTIPAGAVPASTTQRAILVSITPFDPAQLGALPTGLHADGNAYRVTMAYSPSGQPIPASAHPVDLIIETPVPSVALLSSADGQTWARIADNHIPGRAAVFATFTNLGYFLAASGVPAVTEPVVPVVTRPVARGPRLLLVVIVGLVAVLSATAALIWRIGRRRRAG